MILAIVLFSFYLLFVFVLYNFPYESVVKRADEYLRSNYSIGLRTDNIRYRYPFKVIAEGIRIIQEKDSIFINIDKVLIHFRLIGFSGSRYFTIDATDARLDSNFIVVSEANASLMLKMRPRRLLAGAVSEGLDSVGFSISDALVERLSVSGFEFSSVGISQVELLMNNRGEDFNFERALIESDLFSSELSGQTDLETIDITVSISLLNEFFRRYASLSGVVDSISRDNTIRIEMRGNIKHPSVRLIKGSEG